MKRILVTGGAGFISSNMIRYLLHETPHDVVTMDALTYAGNMANLADVIEHERLRFIHGDIRDVADVTAALEGVDVIVNAAAESHVSKSIEEGGAEFVTTNVVGTQVLLDAMRKHPVERFILISSSEVYGTAGASPWTRTTRSTRALPTRARRRAATAWPTRTGARTTCRSRSSARSTTTGRTSTPRRSSRASSSRRSATSR